MKVLTFSRTFLGYHSKAGQPTHFVEQVLNALGIDYRTESYIGYIHGLNVLKINDYGDELRKVVVKFAESLNPEITNCKLHTIRASDHFKPGEYFSPVIWSDKPYRSPQIIFAPPVKIKQVIPFDIDGGSFYLGSPMRNVDDKVELIAKNDGLSEQDFKDWFKYPKPFQGNVLAWEEVNY